MAVVYKPTTSPKAVPGTSKSNAQQEIAGWMKTSTMVVDRLVDRMKQPKQPSKAKAR